MPERQLQLGFTDPLPDQAETTQPDAIEQIVASLRPRVLAYLGDVGGAVGIHELRSALGHAALDTEPDPQANPVNRILKEMRDAGELVCNEPEWGEPSFSLPEATRTEPAGDVFAPGSQGRDMEPVADHHRPYTLDDYRTFYGQLDERQLTAADLQADFRRLQASREQFIAGLQQTYNATQLKSLAFRVGCFDARQNNKSQNTAAIFRNLSGSFALGRSVMYQPMSGESYEDAVAKVVAAITDDDVAGFVEEHRAEAARDRKAIENPETLDEFRIFVTRNGADALSHHQLVAFDRLRADRSRDRRAEQRRPATVDQFAGDTDGLQITIKKGFHDKQQIALWICQVSERVDRPTFLDLKRKAQQLGGWYSSFKKSDAGFQFKNQDSAEKFRALLAGSVDRTDELTDRKTRKMDTASDRLIGLADDLETRAGELLEHGQTTLQNTVRRSEMAAGTRGHAYAELAFVGTMRNIAAELASGAAQYLDGVGTKTQLSTLITAARRAKTNRNRKLLSARGELGLWERHRAVEEFDNRPMAIEDADHAEYPFPTVYRRHLQEAILQAQSRKGLMQRARRMKKHLQGEDEFIPFRHEQDVEALADFCSRCTAVGLRIEWLDRSLDDYKRLRAANVYTLPELRMALRELLPHLKKKQDDDPVLKAEQALIGKPLDGFFPTPKAIVSRMLELADVQPGHRVLEPSAGKGDILDMLREQHPDAQVHAIELNGTLFDVLEAKGHQVERGDFLEHRGEYDRIVMNPPFEKG